MKTSHRLVSRGIRLATAGSILTAGACSFDEVLTARNPDEIPEESLAGNPSFIAVLVAGVKGDMVRAFDDPFVWRGSMLTDETLTGVAWEQTGRLNQRIVQFDEWDAYFMFARLSRALFQADSVSGRLKQLLDSPNEDERLATTLAYAGYGYVFLADVMCEATINVGSTLHHPRELYRFAVDRFDEALPIARASGAEDVENLIHVGSARAHLNLGDYSDVMTIAPKVPEDFRWYAEYKYPEDENLLAYWTRGPNHALSVHPHFLANPGEYGTHYDQTPDLKDPRVQHFPKWRTGHNLTTRIYTPYAPLMWSTYNGETIAEGGEPSDLREIENAGADIAFASGLEAQHDYFEALDAAGGNDAAVLDFVNERRAFGNQAAVSLSGTELTMELRDQRGRDLFLAGYRLGDLRRWLRGGDDMFPSGPHPVTEWGDYGDATCFPLPLSEYEGNPNINLPG